MDAYECYTSYGTRCNIKSTATNEATVFKTLTSQTYYKNSKIKFVSWGQ